MSKSSATLQFSSKQQFYRYQSQMLTEEQILAGQITPADERERGKGTCQHFWIYDSVDKVNIDFWFQGYTDYCDYWGVKKKWTHYPNKDEEWDKKAWKIQYKAEYNQVMGRTMSPDWEGRENPHREAKCMFNAINFLVAKAKEWIKEAGIDDITDLDKITPTMEKLFERYQIKTGGLAFGEGHLGDANTYLCFVGNNDTPTQNKLNKAVKDAYFNRVILPYKGSVMCWEDLPEEVRCMPKFNPSNNPIRYPSGKKKKKKKRKRRR